MKKFYRTACVFLFILVLGESVVAEDWIYTVRKGDTLWDLCIEYTHEKGCWQKVGPYNGVDYPPSLAPGTRIRFPAAWLKNQPAAVELIRLFGEVEISDASNTVIENPQAGILLQTGTRIYTKHNGLVSLRFADGSILVLEANSELILDTLSRHAQGGMVDSRLRLLRGSSEARVKKRGETKSHFSVTTPSAVAAVRGTEFSVEVDADNPAVTLNSVFEGLVAVGYSDIEADNREVSKGYGIKVEENKPLPEPVRLLPSTSTQLAEDVYTLPYTLKWKKVKDATSYRFLLYEDSAPENILQASQVEKNQLEINGVAPGCYGFRLNPLDTNGLVGMPHENRICLEEKPANPVQRNTRDRDGLIFILLCFLVGL